MEESLETEIYFEWPDQYGIKNASIGHSIEQLKEESQIAMNIAMSSIRAMAYKVSHMIKEVELETRPDEVEVEFSLKLELEGGAVIPMVAKTTAGGQFMVKFKWVLEKPAQAKVLIRPDK